MKSNTSIEKLIDTLSNSSKEDYDDLLKNINFTVEDFKIYENWSKTKYTRNCIYRTTNFELILICWQAEQETAIHNHNGEDCWVYLLEGSMEEVFYRLDGEQLVKTHSHNIASNQLTFMNDALGFHKLKNNSKTKAVSLHIYAKPIKESRCFDMDSKTFIERKLSYDSALNALV